MARIALILLAALAGSSFASNGDACPPLSLPTGLSLQTLGNRTFHLYVPKIYNVSISPVPIVVYAHGWLVMGCQDFPPDFMNYSDSRNFIFVSMCGDSGDASFNAGTCCGPSNTNGIDDVGFARNIVGNLSKTLCIDPKRTFFTGFSNGAELAQIIACEASDFFPSVASVSGVVSYMPGNAEALAICDAKYAKGPRKANVLDVHGLNDILVPMGGDAFAGFPPVMQNMLNWTARNLCAAGPPVQTFNNSEGFSNMVWKSCGVGGNSTIELVIGKNSGHEWPGIWPFDFKWSATEYLLTWFGIH